MSTTIYSKEDYEKEMFGYDCFYFCKDIENEWIGESKLLYISQEGKPTTQEESFAYVVIDTILEGKECIREWESKEGEEIFREYKLDKGEQAILKDILCLEEIRDKEYKVIKSSIPGLVDYLFFF